MGCIWRVSCRLHSAKSMCVLLRQVKMFVCAADWFVLMGWRLVKKMSSWKNGHRNARIWTQDLPISNPMVYNWAHSPCVGSKYFTDLLLNSNSVNFILKKIFPNNFALQIILDLNRLLSIFDDNESESSRHSSMVSMAACYQWGLGSNPGKGENLLISDLKGILIPS